MSFLRQSSLNVNGIIKRVLLIAFFIFLLLFFYSVWFVVDVLPDFNVVLDSLPVSTKILDSKGILLFEIFDEVKRTPISLSEISPHMINATLVAEDKNFYSHLGVAPLSIFRAFHHNLTEETMQGGSTITQQLIKNTLLTREKTVSRKIKEALLSLRLEYMASKDEILLAYLNSIPYGRNAYGVEAASWSYFEKPASKLTLSESVFLAAVVKAPSKLSPFGVSRERLDGRALYLLYRMKLAGVISAEEYDGALKAPPVFAVNKSILQAPHFSMWIKNKLIEKYGYLKLVTKGLKVETTLDVDLTKEAEYIIKEQMLVNEKKHNAFNASLVAIDPKSSALLAMVGGKNYFSTSYPALCIAGNTCKFDPQVNASITHRQMGSSFKPYTYLTAFSSSFGYKSDSKILDRRENFAAKGYPPYVPANYTGKSYGMVTLRQALAGSLNVPAVRLIKNIGVDQVKDTVHKIGIKSPLNNCGLSMTLGACELTLLEHTNAFANLANLGMANDVYAISKIIDNKNIVIYEHKINPQRKIEEPAIRELISVMSDRQARKFVFGEGRNLYLSDRVSAVKTGTSQNFRDGVTVGFVPSLAVGVWVGNNDASYMRQGADGSIVAAPIWKKFMQTALKNTLPEDWNIRLVAK